jgi:hypothetical protein
MPFFQSPQESKARAEAQISGRRNFPKSATFFSLQADSKAGKRSWKDAGGRFDHQPGTQRWQVRVLAGARLRVLRPCIWYARGVRSRLHPDPAFSQAQGWGHKKLYAGGGDFRADIPVLI